MTLEGGARANGGLCLGLRGSGRWMEYGRFGLVTSRHVFEAKRIDTWCFWCVVRPRVRGFEFQSLLNGMVKMPTLSCMHRRYFRDSTSQTKVEVYYFYTVDPIVNIPSSYTRVRTLTRSPSIPSSKYYTYRVVKCVVMPEAVLMTALIYPHS
jgi:hypothetical protein